MGTATLPHQRKRGETASNGGMHSDAGKGMKIVEADESVRDDASEAGYQEEVMGKNNRVSEARPVTARIVA